MQRSRAVLAATVALLALGAPLAPPAYAEPVTTPAAAPLPNGVALELTPERTTWKLNERVPVTGRLTGNGQPIANATIGLGLDGDVGAQFATTGPDGRWRAEMFMDESWGMTEHSLYAQFGGDPTFASVTVQVAITAVADRVTPTVLTVAPYPDPVRAGQTVRLTGSVRKDDNQPAPDLQVMAETDPAVSSFDFANTDGQGNFILELDIPAQAGAWSREFPRYPVKVRHAGDFFTAPAEQEVVLTLAEPPPPVRPVATATPTVRSAPEPARIVPSTPAATSAAPKTAQQVGAMLLPTWLTSRATLVAIGALLMALVGAAMVSHGLRRSR